MGNEYKIIIEQVIIILFTWLALNFNTPCVIRMICIIEVTAVQKTALRSSADHTWQVNHSSNMTSRLVTICSS